MNKILDHRPIILLGDIHGDWNVIERFCKEFSEFNIIQLGDFGIGFDQNKNKESRKFENLSNCLKDSNNSLFIIRGNHDDPNYFDDRVVNERITFLSDYSHLTQNDKNILCIGGGISIDRMLRKENVSWWKDEKFIFDLEKMRSVDVLLTHVAPNNFPISKEDTNPMIAEFAKDDPSLISELKMEKFIVGEASEISGCKRHYFGHYHISYTYENSNVKYRCLDINEFVELKFE